MFVIPKAFGGHIFGGAYSEGLIIGRNFSCVQKWVGLESKNSQQQKDNSLKQLTLKVHGLIFGRALYRAHFPREGFNNMNIKNLKICVCSSTERIAVIFLYLES